MISIVYLEEKILTRTAFVLAFEKQEGCKVVYAAQCVETFIIHIQKQKH